MLLVGDSGATSRCCPDDRVDWQHAHTFVVRLWLEGREIPQTRAEWRGRIEHLQSGERLYFREVTEIIPFVRGYTESSSELRED